MSGTPASSSSESTRTANRRPTAITRADPELLGNVGLFADLTTAELVGLAALMRPRPYAKDEVIYLKGDAGHRVLCDRQRPCEDRAHLA